MIQGGESLLSLTLVLKFFFHRQQRFHFFNITGAILPVSVGGFIWLLLQKSTQINTFHRRLANMTNVYPHQLRYKVYLGLNSGGIHEQCEHYRDSQIYQDSYNQPYYKMPGSSFIKVGATIYWGIDLPGLLTEWDKEKRVWKNCMKTGMVLHKFNHRLNATDRSILTMASRLSDKAGFNSIFNRLFE